MQALKEDIENSRADVEDVKVTGRRLVDLCGEPDRPEVEKNIEEADTGFHDVENKMEARAQLLMDALNKATKFQADLIVSSIKNVNLSLCADFPMLIFVLSIYIILHLTDYMYF